MGNDLKPILVTGASGYLGSHVDTKDTVLVLRLVNGLIEEDRALLYSVELRLDLV